MKEQRGQAMILMALALVALIAVTGLAIDGGRAYSQRRNVQNAADAAAMAGTLKLAEYISGCESGTAAQNDQVQLAIEDYAQRNGLAFDSDAGALQAIYIDKNENVLGTVGEGAIPQYATGVQIRMVMSDTTTFMGMMGQNSMTASADSTAVVGTVSEFLPGQGGLLPVAVDYRVVESFSPGQTFYLMENNAHNGGYFCLDAAGANCLGEFTPHNAHRGWLNLNFIYNIDHISAGDPLNRTFETNAANRPCGGDPTKSVDDGLQGWAGDDKDGDGKSDCPYPFTVFAGEIGSLNGDFIHGDPGARQSSLKDVISTYNHKMVYVPLFDAVYTSEYMEDHLPESEVPPDGNFNGWPRAGGGNHAFNYHIVGFAAIEIDDPNAKDHILVGKFQSAIIGQGPLQLSDGIGAPGCSTQLTSLSLWR